MRRFKDRSRADRIARPFVASEQLRGQGFELAHALVGAYRLADRQDPDRGVTLLDHVPQHVEVRVVRDAGLANAPDRRPDRGLRAVDRLAAAEVEFVARAPAGGPALAAELDPFRVVRALAPIDD